MKRFNFPNQNLTKITHLCTYVLVIVGICALCCLWRWNEWYFLKTVEMQIWKQIPSKMESFIGQEKHLIF